MHSDLSAREVCEKRNSVAFFYYLSVVVIGVSEATDQGVEIACREASEPSLRRRVEGVEFPVILPKKHF